MFAPICGMRCNAPAALRDNVRRDAAARTDAIDGRLRWDASVAALMECMRCSFDEALQVWRQVEVARPPHPLRYGNV